MSVPLVALPQACTLPEDVREASLNHQSGRQLCAFVLLV